MPAKPTVQEELLAACKECRATIDGVISRELPFVCTEGDTRMRWTMLQAARHSASFAIERAEREATDASGACPTCADFANPAALPEIVVFLRMLKDPSDGDPTEWPMTTATLLAKLDTPADAEGGA